MKRFRPVCWVSFLFLLLIAGPAQSGAGWEKVNEEDGVTVFRQDVAERDLPTFRGQATFNANIYVILAILSDVERHPEWQHACKHARILKKYDEFHYLYYNRINSPWPVTDRDVVLDTRVHIKPERHTVVITLNRTTSSLMPEVEDVVRMPRLKGAFRLKALDAERTFVQYDVDADPGGALPDFVVKMASEDIPLNTLRNLRARATSPGMSGQYKAFIQRWDPRHNPEAPVVIPK